MLRDRVAGNIALAGEQELMNAAYAQNISVTVPANTRFYVVLQKAAMETTTPAPTRVPEPATQAVQIPTVQELRELMELRREFPPSNRWLWFSPYVADCPRKLARD